MTPPLRRSGDAQVRPAIQAGRFYEADPDRLRQGIEQLLAAAEPESSAEPESIERSALALLVPHAGYGYSGKVAAAGWRAVRGQAIGRVLILAPSHYYDLDGAALPSSAAFATPLGPVPVDRDAVHRLVGQPLFCIEDAAHDEEHAIEVQLPLMQVALGPGPQILPVALGRVTREGLELLTLALAELIEERQAAGQRWLVVASSDTYHGHHAEACLKNDERLMELLHKVDVERYMEAIKRRDVMACGWGALALAMMLARHGGARAGRILERSDSQAAGGRGGDYVVGYVAAVFAGEPAGVKQKV